MYQLGYQLGVDSSSAKLVQAARWLPKVTPGMAEPLSTNLSLVQVMDSLGKIYYCNPAELCTMSRAA